MSKSVLYSVLLTFASSILLFLVGFGGWQLGMTWLAAGLYGLAIRVIWLAFILLILLQTVWILHSFCLGIIRYFRQEAVATRRVARFQMCLRDAKQKQALEKRQLHYQNQMKRKRLLAADDKRNSSELFNAINAELSCRVAPVKYKLLQKQLKQHHKHVNPQAMLALREQALCQSSVIG